MSLEDPLRTLSPRARAWGSFVQRFRKLKVHWVLLASTLLATALVLGALVMRQRAARTGTEAHIPMRQLTVEEAAALLGASESRTAILSLSPDEVVLGTADYPLLGPNPSAWRQPDGKAAYSIASATWEDYYSRYVIPRAPLEQALGKRLGPESVRPETFAGEKLSFDASWVAGYVLCEIAFFSFWILLFVLTLQRLRRWTLVLPALWLWLFLPWPFALKYSPAFYDADWFFQRVLVERVALLGFHGLFPLTLPAVISLFVWAVLFTAETLAKRVKKGPSPGELSSLPTASYRRRALWALVALAAGFLLIRSRSYWIDRDLCLAELSALEKRADTARLEAALTLNRAQVGALCRSNPDAWPREAIDSLLAAGGCRIRGPELLLFVPTDRAPGEFLFLWRNGFAYADFRTPGPGFGNQIDASFLATLDEEPRTSSWHESLAFKRPMCGRRSRLGGRVVTAAVKLDRPYDEDSREP